MAAVPHGSARTAPRVRAELQAARASSRALAAQYGLNPKTVLKWRKRPVAVGAPMRPKPRSATLAEAEEAIVAEFRRRTLLPLDDARRSSCNDVMGCLRDTIPKLTRSALHRCLARHGTSRLPKDEDASSNRKPFKDTKIGHVHVDRAQFRSAEGKTHMCLATDRASKFVRVEFHPTAEMATGAQFMRGVAAAFPCQAHAVLTDNSVAFTKNAPAKRDGRRHVSGRVCGGHGIEHRLTKPYHPWANGQAGRTNRTVKDATVKAFHYGTTQALCARALACVAAYNVAKHLKALRWRTPFQAVCDAWKTGPASFKINPHHLTTGLYT